MAPEAVGSSPIIRPMKLMVRRHPTVSFCYYSYMNKSVLSYLIKGDKRTVTGVNLAVDAILKDTQLINDLLRAYDKDNEALNLRLSDTLQKVQEKDASLLKPYCKQIFMIFNEYEQKEVRWHMAQILPHLDLNREQLSRAVAIWQSDFYTSSSSIVRTFSLQAVYDITSMKSEYIPVLDELLNHALSSGSPAMKSRAALLLKALSKNERNSNLTSN